MSGAHMLGPWTVGSDTGDKASIYGAIGRIAIARSGEANRDAEIARLIAAAPELLEALQFITDVARSHTGFSPMAIKDAAAALAKARGAS